MASTIETVHTSFGGHHITVLQREWVQGCPVHEELIPKHRYCPDTNSASIPSTLVPSLQLYSGLSLIRPPQVTSKIPRQTPPEMRPPLKSGHILVARLEGALHYSKNDKKKTVKPVQYSHITNLYNKVTSLILGPKGGYTVENALYNQVTSLLVGSQGVATTDRSHCKCPVMGA